jgi:ArsR family transcriptional regulator, arsenate/arsenite/antimonite-responsive transcriptional repressor
VTPEGAECLLLAISQYFHRIENMKADDAILALGALAHTSRLAIFRLLVKRGPQGYTPGELTQKLGVPAPTMSFHLRELLRAGLVDSRREGRFLYYSAAFERMRGLIDFLTDKCCSLSDVECDSACAPVGSSVKRRQAS